MRTLSKTAWEILNATADDRENLEQIYRQVCYELIVSDKSVPPHGYRVLSGAPLLSEIADEVRGLVDQGLLQIVMDENGHPWSSNNDVSFVWRAWFQMTSQGKAAWKSAEKRHFPEAKPRRSSRRKVQDKTKRQETRARRRSA